MAEVDIVVNERVYRVTCDEGQEPRLLRLASHIDGHVRSLVRELGQIGDARLMLLAALSVSDELFEARANLAEIGDGAAPSTRRRLAGRVAFSKRRQAGSNNWRTGFSKADGRVRFAAIAK